MKKTAKKYSLTSFKLWKNINGKWCFYNAIFDHSDKSSLSYMSACKLINRGWTPYPIAGKPGITSPLNLELVDTKPLDEYLKEKDPVSFVAGECIKEFLNKPVRKYTDVFTPESTNVADLALQKAIEDYKNGKYVLPHLLKKVLEHYAK
ncbi:hypothetical protein [Nostoc phage A1]|nr:hypothetical protein [Nostoc phage A1]